MRKLLLVTILFAAAQICHPTGAWSEPPQTEPTAELRGGEGFRPGGGFHGDGEMHQGGGRGGATGGQWQRGGRGEFREHQRHEGLQGGAMMVPGYYPYYYPYGYYPDPSDEAPDYQEPDFDLYCYDPQGYFPNVVQCNGEWDEVPR